MFDQWYCHRPSKSHEPNQQYLGAANPQVEQGMAFVDTCHFIFPKNECIQLQDMGWERNQLQNFVSAQLLELMEDQNVRKFLVYPHQLPNNRQGRLLWVFNPDIKYSSSRLNAGRPRRAMKILYKPLEDPTDLSSKMSTFVEELTFPPSVFKQLEEDLDFSNSILPEPARHVLPKAAMQAWKVGMLDRF
ncbi:MAG: hypothetical protein LQ340_003323 [Diploschistes diacapsis]|nr:MAG: hypothetical protein LQ340_003323 [Diploschistes diacapsis]